MNSKPHDIPYSPVRFRMFLRKGHSYYNPDMFRYMTDSHNILNYR